MVENEQNLAETNDCVHESMCVENQLNNETILRNLTEIKPVMHNGTHWSGKLHMPRLFMQIRDELVEIRNSDARKLRWTGRSYLQRWSIILRRCLRKTT